MRAIQIQIPEPCHEDWTKMLREEKGRFCHSCAKTVVDFSVMSDQQVLDYLANFKNQSVCGRMHQDQLDRSITPFSKPKKKIFLYWQYIVAFVLMIARPSGAKAQGEIKRTLTGDTIIVEKIESPVIAGMITTQIPKEKRDNRKFRVLSENMEPVAGTSVEIKPSAQILITDDDGWVEIPQKIKWELLTFTAIGYEKNTITVSNGYSSDIILRKSIELIDIVAVEADFNERRTMGAMVSHCTRDLTIRQVFADSLSAITNVFAPVRIYPNPIERGGTLKANLNVLINNEYLLSIISVNGLMLLQKELKVIYVKSIVDLPIPTSWAAGSYQLVLQNKKSGKKISQPFIVL